MKKKSKKYIWQWTFLSLIMGMLLLVGLILIPIIKKDLHKNDGDDVVVNIREPNWKTTKKFDKNIFNSEEYIEYWSDNKPQMVKYSIEYTKKYSGLKTLGDFVTKWENDFYSQTSKNLFQWEGTSTVGYGRFIHKYWSKKDNEYVPKSEHYNSMIITSKTNDKSKNLRHGKTESYGLDFETLKGIDGIYLQKKDICNLTDWKLQ